MYNHETDIPTVLPTKKELYGNIESKLFTTYEEL